MNGRSFERWEAYVEMTAGAFPYPPTPDIAGTVRQRLAAEPRGPVRPRWRPAWAAAIALIVLAGLLAVPRVRAGLLEVLRIGAVRILLAEPTPTPTPPPLTPTGVPPTSAPGPVAVSGPTATPSDTPTRVPPTATPTPTPLTSVLDLAGETTPAEAQAKVDFPIRRPAYPPDLGPPDRVFLQDLGGGPAVILVWLEPDRPGHVRLSLHELGQGTLVEKGMPRIIRETTVNGQRALWTEGPYLLRVRSGDYEMRRLVEGHVLIWVEDEVTYRLETDLSLEEAVRIAESLLKVTARREFAGYRQLYVLATPASTAASMEPADTPSTDPARAADDPPDTCPTTRPPSPPFIPPSPYSPNAPYADEFWYGTEALWTMLRTDGRWWHLPHNETGYTQKVFWWRKGYNWREEPQPRLVVTGRRLDRPTPPLLASRATNAFHPSFKSAMLVGVDIPTLGCWEITGHYGGHELSFVVWVAP